MSKSRPRRLIRQKRDKPEIVAIDDDGDEESSCSLLTKDQAAALGKNYSPAVYTAAMADLHTEAPPDVLIPGEIEQTYDEFVDMGKRQPNRMGTGRFKLTKQRKTLGFMHIKEEHPPTSSIGNKEKGGGKRRKVKSTNGVLTDASALGRWLKDYFCVDLDIVSTTLILKREASSNTNNNKGICTPSWALVDETRGLEFPIRSWASADSPNSDGILDVFSLFDIMTEYVKKSHYSLLWAVEADLGEELGEDSDDDEEDPAPYTSVLGRACGDRVCVVSTKNTSLRGLVVTALHEIGHNFGLDHCTSWKCLMNAMSTEEEFLFLSPTNLRKLLHIHGMVKVDHQRGFLLERYRNLERLCASAATKKDFGDCVPWLAAKIAILVEQQQTTKHSKAENPR